MRRVILTAILSLSLFQMGCSSLKCGCGDDLAAKKAESATTEADKKSCGCEGCKHAAGESCSMKK